MATRRKDSDLDVVQADGPGPSVVIPYPGSTLPSSPLAVTPVAAKQLDELEEDDADEDEADEDETEDEADEDEDSDEVESRTPARAFMQPFTPSPALAAIVGSDPLTRVEMTKRVWSYIAKNKLQDPQNKRFIRLDAALKAIFGDQDRINMFEMTVALNRHLT
ncbi:MAG: SWIB/MDM2 domain-containing protein [Myxococcaceae bacterium]